jgi:(1->4)-alpha-D-glucan 1-alpha-D-glucosylmutase
VDFELRDRMLAELEQALEVDPVRGPGVDALLAGLDDGLPKLWLHYRVLHLRTARPEAFGPEASYRPLAVSGRAAEHVVAFIRGEQVATIVPRLPLKLARGRMGARLVAPSSRWADTYVELSTGRWRDHLTGDRHVVRVGAHGLRLARVLGRFPVALLEKEES